MRWYAFLFILNGFRYHRYINPLIFVAVLSRQVWQGLQTCYPLTACASFGHFRVKRYNGLNDHKSS